MSSIVGLVSLALLFAYMISKTMGKGLNEAIQRRRLERSKRRKLERDKRKAERAFRSEQSLLKISKMNDELAKIAETRGWTVEEATTKDINCPQCNHRLRIPARHTANTICPACDSIFSSRKLTGPPYKKRGKRVDRQVQQRDSKGRFRSQSPFDLPPPPTASGRRAPAASLPRSWDGDTGGPEDIDDAIDRLISGVILRTPSEDEPEPEEPEEEVLEAERGLPIPKPPPIPPEGLPAGWSSFQWVHYGQRYLDQQVGSRPPSRFIGIPKLSPVDSGRFLWTVETYTAMLVEEHDIPEEQARIIANRYYSELLKQK